MCSGFCVRNEDAVGMSCNTGEIQLIQVCISILLLN